MVRMTIIHWLAMLAPFFLPFLTLGIVEGEGGEKKTDEEGEISSPVPEDKLAAETDTPPEGYTAEEWADLSTTEREGILDSIMNEEVGEITETTPTDEEKADLEKIAHEGETDEEKTKRLQAEDEGKSKDTKNEGKTEAEIAAEGKADEALAAERATPGAEEEPGRVSDEELLKTPIFVDDAAIEVKFEIPKEKQKEHEDKIDAIDQKVESGELTRREADREIRTLERDLTMWVDDQKRGLERGARADALWGNQLSTFAKARPEYIEKAPDYRPENKKFTIRSQIRWSSLNTAVQAVRSDPANRSLTGMQVLVMADKIVRESLGPATTPKSGTAAPATTTKGGGKPAAERPDARILGGVPNAAPNTSAGVFAQLDKLKGEAYEAALEKLTPDQRAAYELEADMRSGATRPGGGR